MATAPPLAPPEDLDRYGPIGRSEWLDIDWREHQRWVSVGGCNVNVVEMGEGPSIVFVHGLGGCWQNWLENIPHFAESHRVIALDLPGFGHSDMPPDDISIPGYGGVVEAVCEELGVQSAALVGNSLGAFVAAEVAIQFPSRVNHLVLASAAILWQERRRAKPLVTLGAYTEAYAAWFSTKWELAFEQPRLRHVILSQIMRHPNWLPRELIWEQMAGSGKPGFVQANRALTSYSIRDHLPKIEASTLIIWGRNDQMVRASDADTLQELIPGSEKVIFEDTGHVPMFERPVRFNYEVERFLRS